MRRTTARAVVHGAFIIPFFLGAVPSFGQERLTVTDSLVARAMAANPRLRAAEAQAAAARSRITPAAAWPDPMLMAGVQNLPLTRESADGGMAGGPEPMTMTMLGIGQTVPFPGKTSLRSSAARADAEAAEARAATVRLTIRRDVLDAYSDLWAAGSVLMLVEKQQQVALSVLPAAEARYVAGTAAQSDVLKARTEAAFLVEERNAAEQQQRAALARLSAALGESIATSVMTDELSTDGVASSLPSLDSLLAVATRSNPGLRERRATIAAQTVQVRLARREYLPDFDVTVQYGQRDGLPDMITAMIGVPVPLQRGRKQNALTRAAQHELVAAEAELRAEENELRAQIAASHAQAERHRANAELLNRAILPQAQATFASASASYQSGRGELLNVLDAMRALFATETMYVRTLAEFAKTVAELQMLVGGEVVR